MPGDRAAHRQRNGRQCHDDSMSDLPARYVAHQFLREEKGVERAPDDPDNFSDALVERRVGRFRQASDKDVSVEYRHRNDGDDCRHLGEQSVTNGAEPAIAPRRNPC